MMRRLLIAALAFALASCGGGGHDRPTVRPAPAVNAMQPSVWEIGPITENGNYSVGMPLHPYATVDGWAFDFPPYPGSVHYVTARLGSLAGKSRLVLRYRIEAAEGVDLKPITGPDSPSLLTLYFQRRGDDWSAQGKFERFRWYASGFTQAQLRPGEFELAAPLDGPGWTAVETSTFETAYAAFADAKANADRVGFVFGGGTGLGHGVYATGRARFIVESFTVE
jgi:hypothetical protein